MKRVERGEVILIGRYGRVVAKLVPPDAPPKPKRVPGVWKGKVWIASDFDEPNADNGPDDGGRSDGTFCSLAIFPV